jgi:hypothetical protein
MGEGKEDDRRPWGTKPSLMKMLIGIHDDGEAYGHQTSGDGDGIGDRGLMDQRVQAGVGVEAVVQDERENHHQMLQGEKDQDREALMHLRKNEEQETGDRDGADLGRSRRGERHLQ